tara:strand:+ start:115 stop:549 length:435 start_codon:yes stop_codon:yes gene_type:complete
MTDLVFNRDEELAAWAESNYPDCAPLPRPLTAIGIADKGAVIAVAVFHDFVYPSIEVTFIAATRSRWATKQMVKSLLHYPFFQLNVKRMTAVTSKSNKKARKLLMSLGFALEGVHPFATKGQTACSYGLYRDVAVNKWFSEESL